MSKAETVKTLIHKIAPYLIIVVAAFISTLVYFNEGIAPGDDIAFHLSMTNDVLYGFKHGYFSLSANHLHMGGFALNNYAFYGPLTHWSAAILTGMFEWAGATAIFGLKAVVILSAVMGGIYTYFLGVKMTKGNRMIGLICAVIFVFLPYRVFCALARCAFAESVAICFIPVVFYGCYSVLNDEEYSVHAYVAICVGGIGVVLSHAFTGLMTAAFAALYLIFNIQKLIKRRNGFSIWPSLGVAVLICCLCLAFYIGNSMSYKSTGLYNLCDPIKQWTNFEHVSASTANSNQFSGFLNFIVISGWQGTAKWNDENVSYLTISILIYFVSMVFVAITDVLLRKAPHNKYYRYVCDIVAGILLPTILQIRQEVWVSLAISIGVYLFISFLFDYEIAKGEKEKKSIVYNPDFYFVIFSLIICFILLYIPKAWNFVPSIMYECQFAWRLWGITSFFITMLIMVLLMYVKLNKRILLVSGVIGSALVALSMGQIEKRVYYEVESTKIIQKGDEDYTKTIKYSGAQNEMVPQVFYDDYYKCEYTNSLYKSVKYSLYTWSGYFYDAESYINPVFLTGTGEILIYEYNSPNNVFSVNVTSETALIQLPQFYYEGYSCYIDGNFVSEGINVDGLVAFNIPKGEYKLSVVFKESKAYQATMPLFWVGSGLLISGGVFGVFYRKKIIPAKLAKKTAQVTK